MLIVVSSGSSVDLFGLESREQKAESRKLCFVSTVNWCDESLHQFAPVVAVVAAGCCCWLLLVAAGC